MSALREVGGGRESPRAGVIGWPIAQSRSPLIHNHWLATYGLKGSYIKQAVAPNVATDFFATMAADGWAGCNVTVPHKAVAFAAAHQKDATAVAVEAANTLWVDDGQLCAANTDTEGFMAHLDTTAPLWRQRDAPVVIFGSGGAARAIVYGFLVAGVSRIIVINRTYANAETLAAHFGRRVEAAAWGDRHRALVEAGVIVNTTTLGMTGSGAAAAGLDIDVTTVRYPAVVADIVYVPLETPLLSAARAAGHTAVDGLGMLLHQAVPGFEKWFGVRPEVTDALRDLVRADLEQTA